MSSCNSGPPLLIIVGPTASGKSALAIEIAKKWNGEIINADSMQVYRHMDIGTAKPDAMQRKGVPHHLIDVVDPDEEFNAAIYTGMARAVIHDLVQRKPVVVAGGTGLYIKTLLGGIVDVPATEEAYRRELQDMVRRHGAAYLHGQLRERDPLSAQRIHPSDTGRIIRALDVWNQSGKSIIEEQRSHRFTDRRYRYCKIGLLVPRKLLHHRIDRRTEEMISRGLADEVQWLLEQGYHEELKSMRSLGYRHMIRYLRGDVSRDEAVLQMKKDTRSYAKRQMTWFSADREIRWVSADALSAARDIADGLFS